MLDPAIAKIIYFPNKRMAFQPTIEDIPITFNQVEDIRNNTKIVSRIFDGNEELVIKHIYNKLRVLFCVQRLEDIPRQHFNEALNLINQVEKELKKFRYFTWELQKKFAEKILRNGDPWAPSTKANWCKKIAKEFPERPDWRVLASEIEKHKFRG